MSKQCIYCNQDTKIFRKFNEICLYQCCKCGIVFTDVQKKFIKQINENKYSNLYINNYLKYRSNSLILSFKNKIDFIESIIHGGYLLDIGCSIGLFLEVVKKYSKFLWHLYGLDINKKSVITAKKRTKFDIRLGTIDSCNFNIRFNCITCFDVLEHDINIQNTLKIIAKLLRKKGLLVVQTPNYKSLMALICGSNWDWWCVPDHIFHFSPDTLKMVIEENNFRIIKITSWEPVQSFILNIQGSIKKYLPKYLFINRIVAKLCPIPIFFLWLLIYPFERICLIGGEVVVYAVKK